MAAIEIRCLGGLSVVTTAPVRFPTQKTKSLFAYLLLNAHAVGRDRLAGILWPDASEERARRNLSTAIWRLKSAVQSAPGIQIDVDGNSVKISCEGVDVDVFRFRALVESLPKLEGQSRDAALKEAETLYRGDLLDGLNDEWCEDERRYLRALYARLLKQAVDSSKSAAEFDRAIGYARKLVALDPLDEDSQRELMILYHLTGNRGAALLHYEAAKRLLQDELGIQPSPATLELYHYIRSRSAGQAFPVNRGLGTAEWPVVNSFSSMPMVGRDTHLANVMRVIDHAARGEGAAIVVSGEAGVGKTRLIEAVLVEAGLRGFDVLQGRCLDLQDSPPYHLFIQALWPRILAADKDGEASSPLSVLVHALAPEPFHKRLDARPRKSRHFFTGAIVNEALLSLLTKSSEERPTLLILEDIHRIDKASAALLLSLIRHLSKTKLCAVVSVRSEENVVNQLLSLLSANGASEIKLEPLSEEDTEKLVRATLRSKRLPRELIRFIWQRTNGIPLFALELLRFLQVEGLLTRDPIIGWSVDKRAFNLKITNVPSRMQEVLRQRIRRLEPETREVLCAAAVLGTEVEFNQLLELTDVPEERFIEDTDQLVGAQLLQETKAGFRFAHESTRLVALSTIKSVALRALHRRAAALVLRSAPGQTEDLAWHYEEAGDLAQALRYAEASGDKARAVYANSDAATWYTRALQLFSSKSSSEEGTEEILRRQSVLLLKRQEVLDLLGDRRSQSADIDAIRVIAGRLNDQMLTAESLYLRANLLTRMNADQKALTNIRQAVQLFRATKDLRAEARSYETAGLIYNNLRKYSLASTEFRRALRLFHRVRDRAGQARSFLHLGTLLGFQNKDLAAVKYLDRADLFLRKIEDPRSRAMARIIKGIAYRYLGRLKLSESHIAIGVSIMTQIGDRVGSARGLIHLAYTHGVMGKLRDAIHESERALHIAREAKDVRAQVLILNNAAYGVYRLVGNYARAERYITEAIKLVTEAGGTESAAPYTNTMAAILLDRGDLQAALSWAERGEVLHEATEMRSWIDLEIDYTLGSACLELGQYARATYHLSSARRQYARGQEIAYEALATAALARLHLVRGDLAKAMKSARAVSDLLRKVDGVEQIQKVYWGQYLVFRAAGSHAAARRALRQAYSSVMQQASTLKGRFKRIFLNDVKINREVLEEVGRNHQSIFNYGAGLLSPQRLDERQTGRLGPIQMDGKLRVAGSRLKGSKTRQHRIEARRWLLTSLIERGQPTQSELAAILGVSLRTVRSDLVALRSQGLTPKST